ncbi:MAG TPA: O-antigen translocase [Chitinophagaceae bacterium]|jgi:PST family polysaccharide transporter|nr:O-antigen translocase [Chitinophagaceae bacterium]
MSDKESKKQILKSTGILGSAQLIIIAVGIVRVKILAVLLGASGVGIAGLYQSTIDLVRSVTGFGISYSAVRDIAASTATNDEKKIATTILVLRKWVWATGLLGMAVTIIFSRQLSYMAFGDKTYASGIITLSVGLLLSSLAAGQSALLQGFRKIGDMARANVFGALSGLIGAITIYYFLGLKGIVPALLLTFVLTFLANSYYSRRLKTIPVQLTPGQIFHKGRSMASLGFFLTLTGLASTSTMYLVRSFVMKEGGLASVGYFVAAWSISSMYISAIFGAMGTDFFPRLSGVQADPVAVTKLVNDQTEVALLITAPIIIGMVSFIDLVVRIFYSKDFTQSAGILDWQLTGDFFKVLCWPIGFIMLAKGKGKLFIATELFWNLLFCAGVYFGWKFFGIQITGIAFLFAYIISVFLYFFVANKLVQFNWSRKVWKTILLNLPLLIISLLSVKYLKSPFSYVVGTIMTLVSFLFSLLHIKSMIDVTNILKKFKF